MRSVSFHGWDIGNEFKILIRRILCLILCIFLISSGRLISQDVKLTIHLRGVYDSKITLMPLTGKNALMAIAVNDGVRNGTTATLAIPADYLPGEFVLRFDYRETASAAPYPSERGILINNRDTEFWVHPVFSNSTDSTWFNDDERENAAYIKFLAENSRQKEMLGLLQGLLLNYDDTGSGLFRATIKEYEKRRKVFNSWLMAQVKENSDLFAGSLFRFQYVQEVNWDGSEADRGRSLRDNYFEGVDLSDTLILRTSALKEWMDGYVNLYGELATSVPLRDSLFTLAGKTAVEEARRGDPLVYGWMVDYFFNGYESFNITEGILMLQPYLDDPRCLTSRRKEITRRVAGIETLVPGTVAPDIRLLFRDNEFFRLYDYNTDKEYLILLFWASDCSHCNELVRGLQQWYRTEQIRKRIEIITISLDETFTDPEIWKQKTGDLPEWKHLRAGEGPRDKVAEDYFILGIPVMVLLDAKSREIIALPDSIIQLDEIIINR